MCYATLTTSFRAASLLVTRLRLLQPHFLNEIVLGRRHTTNIMRDLPAIIARAIGQLTDSDQ